MTERFSDVAQIYEQLGELLAESLIGYHAFTGFDFNPAFFNKEKKKTIHLIKKS